jgi:cold shock CspA family protein
VKSSSRSKNHGADIAGADFNQGISDLFRLFDDNAIDSHLRKLSLRPTNSSPTRRKLETQKMHLGTCNRWNNQRAYGFLTADAPIDNVPDRELFAHAKNLPRGVKFLIPGNRVEFETRPSRKAGMPPEAVVVRVIEVAAEAA